MKQQLNDLMQCGKCHTVFIRKTCTCPSCGAIIGGKDGDIKQICILFTIEPEENE